MKQRDVIAVLDWLRKTREQYQFLTFDGLAAKARTETGIEVSALMVRKLWLDAEMPERIRMSRVRKDHEERRDRLYHTQKLLLELCEHAGYDSPRRKLIEQFVDKGNRGEHGTAEN